MSIDTSRKVRLYDPHPGFAGAAIRIPEPVRLVANDLDGKTMTLKEAVGKIKSVTNGKVFPSEEHSFIALRLHNGGLIHMFRVLRFSYVE